MKRKILLTLTVICSMFIISCAPAGGNASEGSSQEMPEEAETLETAAEEIVVQETPEAAEETQEAEKEADALVDPEAEAVIQVTKEAAEKIDEQISDGSDGYKYSEDGKRIVDLIMFMGQSNMSGAGGNAKYAPKVPYEEGFEFRAVSDPTRLYQIEEPFGINENNLNAIMDLPGAKRGSLVSSFANTYFKETGVPVVGVSASAGATDTAFWMSAPVEADYTERLKRAIVWLENDKYMIRHRYVVWLQGESDAVDALSSEKYEENMNNIIRPLFINGVEKVFFITPGRTITKKDYFSQIIASQIKMSRESGYYALGTTILSGISTEYMVDEWHYNQTVLNLVGEESARSVAYYTNTGKEACMYNYRDGKVYAPDGTDPEGMDIKPLDLETCGLKTNLE